MPVEGDFVVFDLDDGQVPGRVGVDSREGDVRLAVQVVAEGKHLDLVSGSGVQVLELGARGGRFDGLVGTRVVAHQLDNVLFLL